MLFIQRVLQCKLHSIFTLILAPGFLELFLYRRQYVCLRVCPPPRLLINSGVMWHDMDFI